MANQTAIYQYVWKHDWHIDAQGANVNSTENQIRADLKSGIAKAAFQELAAKFAEIGRWLVVDSVTVDVTGLQKYGRPNVAIFWNATGTTEMVFRTDATPDQDFYPESGFVGWESILLVIIGTIISVVLAHPGLFFILLIILALAYYNQSGGFKGTLFGQGGGSLADIGTIIAIAILGFGGLLVLSSWLGQRKHRGARRRGASE